MSRSLTIADPDTSESVEIPLDIAQSYEFGCQDELRARLPPCVRTLEEAAAEATTATDPAVRSRAVTEAVVHTVISQLRLPDAAPMIGPDPSVNEWNAAIVGYPYWLWTPGPTRMQTTTTAHGITITMDARQDRTVFDTGDGKRVTCARTTPFTKNTRPDTPSPTCGHVYTWPSRHKSKPAGTYTLTATTYWSVHWTALGYSGTIPVRISDSRAIPVAELHAIARVP
ncbi:MAG: hypothetical protein QM708_02740 [Propioniciclava sp.]|uniref:hypothetical protein n=1 Tax=Propioniciclava sp. TaxID=2038686 RepID=UPI0039E4D26A